MSRIGKLPITIPEGVEVNIKEGEVSCKGPQGQTNLEMDSRIKIEKEESVLKVSLVNENDDRAVWGTYRQLINNMLLGVSEGFEKKMEIVGVGYKAQAQGDKLVLNVGYSNPVEIKAEEGIKFAVEKNIIIVSGIDKHKVGQVAAKIRAVRLPEPYKGKGIRYIDEHVRKKAGKKAVAAMGE
jgi:large subunit ribosomal protein L6